MQNEGETTRPWYRHRGSATTANEDSQPFVLTKVVNVRILVNYQALLLNLFFRLLYSQNPRRHRSFFLLRPFHGT